MNTQIPCPYEMWDGSYLLGSLSPAERRAVDAEIAALPLAPTGRRPPASKSARG